MGLDRKIILSFIFIFVFNIVHLAKTQQLDFYKNRHKLTGISTLQENTGFTVHSLNNEPDSTKSPYKDNDSSSEENISIPPHIIIKEPSPPTTTFHPSDLSFRFSNVGLQRIGRDFITSDSIISLSLDNNNISDISPFAFRSMRNLRHLNLSGNRIPIRKLLLLNGNHKLQTLIINDNNGSNYDSSDVELLMEHETFNSLLHLHLCNDQLRNFRMPFYIGTPVLKHLHLCNNSISSTSAVFDNIPATLTHLNLNKNLIDRVERDKLRYLAELTMDDNKIVQVCFEDCQEESIALRGADRLQNLSLSRNQIAEVTQDAFHDMMYLTKLDLSGNKLANLAKGTFNKTVFMLELSLAHNILAAVPDVCLMHHLKSLNLSGNRISAIFADTFCRLKRLERLYLSDNTLTTIESRAFHLQSLTYLDLSGNQLKQLPGQWIYAWQILELNVERNNFTELDDLSLRNIKSLRNVYIDKNPILKLRAESFESIPGQLTLHLKNVRVECAQCRCNKDDEDDDDEDEDGDHDNDSEYI